MAIKVYPYRAGSRSATALANSLGGRVLRREGSNYRYRPRDTVINWGSTNCPHPCLNGPAVVERAANKLLTFQRLLPEHRAGNLAIPDFWTRREDIPNDAFPIVCRTVLRGHSGNGIVIAASRDELVPAPLYVKYIKKQQEYRVHVGINRAGVPSIIKIQRKARRLDVPDANVNWQVRNLDGGFIYAILEEADVPIDVLTYAMNTISAMGLDFGAVDVVWNERNRQAFVLEVNTACGIEGSTGDAYAAFFRERIG